MSRPSRCIRASPRSIRRAAGAHARRLVDPAGALVLPRLALQAWVELTENHAVFAWLVFRRRSSPAHPG
ncbi:hypothetical protein M2324_001362 [Rhodovulum sulfidophilum]|uniref:hypothetical protein n=1 Tax=Rhodovulum sulfidophilum TaxID=35806 RepID=UPI0005A7B5E7|nr:hypothetical protein [Rhodovulum sulfidophilum]ANB33680.1 hypothetical protein A6W98_06065 [Rhodovulum sulfidophilum DSM 1374]ANB37501.1 hypothetical protein A6024_05915 [Rhodovulum sulfidophilum]MCW2302972.1 hypothetical protein [Rhodovulum sulfidophilum]